MRMLSSQLAWRTSALLLLLHLLLLLEPRLQVAVLLLRHWGPTQLTGH